LNGAIAVAVLQLALAAFFLPSALLKLAGHAHMRREFERFSYPYSVARLAGAIELVAAPCLIAGLWHPPLAVLGALLLIPVMIGATITNFVKRPPEFGWGTLLILLLCVVPVWLHRQALAGWVGAL
jgi:uncharacterized membrane protein YphA (DoxX/SURF4 family)